MASRVKWITPARNAESALMATVKRRRLILAVILAILVYGMTASMLGTLLPDLSLVFNLTPERSANIAFAQALGLIIASILAGPLADNKGKKTGLLLGLVLIEIALLGLPNSAVYEQIMIFMFILGLGGGTLVTSAMAMASDINPERRGTTLNLLTFFFGLGGLLTPFLAANFLAKNVVDLCYVVAVLTAATLLLHWATAMPAPSGERGLRLSEMGVVIGRPPLYLLSMFLFLYMACEVGIWNWLARHLVARGISEKQALNILSLGFALGLLIGRAMVARILISTAASTVTLVASALMAVTTFLALQTSEPTTAWVAVFCAGLAMAPVFPTTLAVTGETFPKATGTAMGIVTMSGWIGLAVSSKIIGGIAAGDNQRLRTALFVLPIFSMMMVLVNLVLRPMLTKGRTATTT
jgi:fucose permease